MEKEESSKVVFGFALGCLGLPVVATLLIVAWIAGVFDEDLKLGKNTLEYASLKRVDLREVAGTGKGGEITPKDVDRHIRLNKAKASGFKGSYKLGSASESGPLSKLNGRRNGLWITTFVKSGEKAAETNWKDGLLHGASIEYHRNGRKRSEIYYTDNIKNGSGKRWDEWGRVTLQGYYHLGNKIGVWVEWAGGAKRYRKKETRYYEDESKPTVEITWNVEGKKLSETHFLNGKKTLDISDWYENGQPKYSAEFVGDKKIVISWGKNGAKKKEGVFSVFTGTWHDEDYGLISIRFDNEKYLLVFEDDGSTNTLRRLTSYSQTKFMADNATGDYYLINDLGELEIWDNAGFVSKAARR